MHSLLFIASAFIGLVAPLSVPFNPSLRQLQSASNDSLPPNVPSPLNASLSPKPRSNSTSPASNGWPSLPFNTKVSEKTTEGVSETTYIIIDNYIGPFPSDLKGFVLGNITLIEELIDGWDNPDYFIDNKRVFTSGVVSARFPAVQVRSSARITNGLAKELLGAAWGLIYAYGPRGWSFASVETVRGEEGGAVRDTVGFFSLWITEPGFYTLVGSFDY